MQRQRSPHWDKLGMDMGYQGRVAVVTGGVSGIGAELVTALRCEGATVEVLDIAQRPPINVADPEQVERAIAELVSRHGRIDVIFSNAGILRAGDTANFPVELFDQTLSVNLRGAFLVARASIPHLRASQGAIVFTASTSAIVGASGEAAYAASKAGITGLARSLAAELAVDGIRVNAVAPGWIDTPFNDPIWEHAGDRTAAINHAVQEVPMKRQGHPAEVIPLMLLLGSPKSTYLTGQVIAVDGGLSTLR